MKNYQFPSLLFCILLFIFVSTGLTQELKEVKDSDVFTIIQHQCSKCHSGSNPSLNLNLESQHLLANTVSKKSQQKKNMKLIDPGKPQTSYLFQKIMGSPIIKGEMMPYKEDPLKQGDILLLKRWIAAMEVPASSSVGQSLQATRISAPQAFAGPQLINLPSSKNLDSQRLLFQISHRFEPTVASGYEDFFGLNGPATIMLSLGYGIGRNLSLFLARSNYFNQYQLSIKWNLSHITQKMINPLYMAINFGTGLATEKIEGRDTFDFDNFKFHTQVIIAYRIFKSFSILLVPGYISNINHTEIDSEGAFFIGCGFRLGLFKNVALIGEWNPVLAGYQKGENGWGCGLEYQIGKHIFHFFVHNSIGLTIDQYASGGTPYLDKGNVRLGFNIFREF